MRRFDTAPAPHLPARGSVRGLMLEVQLALLPGLLVQTWFFGPGVLLQVLLAIGFGLAIEAACLRLRERPLAPFLGDGSTVLAATLFALCLPPLAPWWMAAIGMLAAIGLAKHAYGGLGGNLFNPAMVGYAVVLLSFPLQASQWPGAVDAAGYGVAEALQVVLLGATPAAGWDALTAATPLDALRQLGGQGLTLAEMQAEPRLLESGLGAWGWIASAHAVGGLWLLARRRIPWQTPAGLLGTVVLLSLLPWAMDPDLHPSPLWHLATGATVLGAFFIVTDPVSGCASPRGRLLFGAGVGLLLLAIRRWGAYPDALAFAVLLMNCAAPMLDRYTRPRVYGAPR